MEFDLSEWYLTFTLDISNILLYTYTLSNTYFCWCICNKWEVILVNGITPPGESLPRRLHPPDTLATLLQYSSYILPTIHPTFSRHFGNIHPTFSQYSSNTPATLLQYCKTLAILIQYSLAIFTQHSPNIHPTI